MGRVDTEIQPVVRRALAAVVSQDGDEFAAAVEAIPDERLPDAVRLALAIDVYVLNDIFEGDVSAGDLDRLTTELTASQSEWFGTDDLPVRRFFEGLTEAVPQEGDPGELVALTFVVGGWLLSGFAPQEQEWWQYLNEALDALDAEPAAS